MEDEKDKVVANIRACLISSQGDIKLSELNADYADLCGGPIPFKRLGYSNLFDLIASSSRLRIALKNGEQYVRAEASDESSHIERLVNNQKRAKGKARKPRPLRAIPDSGRRPPKPAPKVPKNNNLPKNCPSEPKRPQNLPPNRGNQSPPEQKPKSNPHYLTGVAGPRGQLPKKGPKGPSNPLKVTSLPQNYEQNIMVRKLLDYIQKKNWPKPEFSAISAHENGKESIISRISLFVKTDSGSITNHQFTSYPNQFSSAIESLHFVADKAYSELLSKDSTLPVTLSTKAILHRIEQMLDVEKCVGFWSHEILLKYQKMYNESLPLNLRSLLAKNGRFDVSVGFDDHRYIIKLQSDDDQHEMQRTLPTLILPSESVWDVFVTKPLAINKVLIRLIGPDFSGQFDTLATDMELEYMNKKLPPPKLFMPGMFYVHVDSDTCSRVYLNSLRGDKLEVHFIDHGDIEMVEKSSVFDIDLKYLCEPSQAFEVYLEGLDEFANTNEQMCYDVFSEIIGKSFVGVLCSREPLSLTLTDTSGKEDVNVNEKIKNFIIDNYFEQKELLVGMTEKVRVISFTPLGDVFLNVISDTLQFLMDKVSEIDSGLYRRIYLSDNSQVVLRENVYFLDSEYQQYFSQRVVAMKFFADQEVQVFGVDTGVYFNVKIEQLYFIENLNEVMTLIPFQAHKVKLFEVPDHILDRQKDFLLETIASRDFATVKVVQFEGEVPLVQLYISVDPNNNNNVISVNEALVVKEKKERNFTKQLSQLSISKTFVLEEEKFGLPKPTIPTSPDELFQVYVLDCASPSNLTIMPVRHLLGLNDIMAQMKDYYANCPRESVKWKIGDVCVAKDDNEYFLRAHIVSFPDQESACVRFFDYGRMSVVPLSFIRKLSREFSSHPFTALNAKLAGIEPRNTDWEVDDVTYTSRILKGKKFYACIKNIETERGKDYSTLTVKLIDTTTQHDVDMSDVLVEAGKASRNVKVTPS